MMRDRGASAAAGFRAARRRVASALIWSAAALAGCAGDGGRRVDVVPERSLEVAVDPAATIHLSIPVGEIEVVGVEGNRLRAQMQIGCPSTTGGCARRAERTELVHESLAEEVRVSVEPDRMNAHKKAAIRVRVELPRAAALDLDIGAGELTVRDVDACPSLRMFAGEAELRLASALVGEVTLDTGFGDAQLTLGDGAVEGRRPFLVGSEVAWSDGSGECRVVGKLSFGELGVYLQ